MFNYCFNQIKLFPCFKPLFNELKSNCINRILGYPCRRLKIIETLYLDKNLKNRVYI